MSSDPVALDVTGMRLLAPEQASAAPLPDGQREAGEGPQLSPAA